MGRIDNSRARNTKWLSVLTAAIVATAMVLVTAMSAQAQTPTLSSSRVAPGDTITVSGNGCTSSEPATFVVVRLLNSGSGAEATADVPADANGDWTTQLTVPTSISAGDYAVAATCEGRNGTSVGSSTPYDPVTLTVADPEPTATPTPTPTSTPEALVTPTPTPTEEATNPTNTPTPGDPKIKLSSSGGRAPFKTTVSGTFCLDTKDKKDTKVELRIINDDSSQALTAEVDNDGAWSKTLSFGSDDVGNNSVKASCVTADDTLFSYSVLTVTVGSPTLSTAEGKLSADKTKINLGDNVDAEATKCPSDSDDDADDFRVRFTLTYQGTDDSWSESEFGKADGDGDHKASIKVDKDAPVGTYLLSARCEEKQSDDSYDAIAEYTNVTVTVFAATTTPTATPTGAKPTPIPTPTPDDIDIGFTG